MTTNSEIYMNCLMVEALVKVLVLKGITDNYELVKMVSESFHPETEWEQEMYSEAILYAKQSVLN